MVSGITEGHVGWQTLSLLQQILQSFPTEAKQITCCQWYCRSSMKFCQLPQSEQKQKSKQWRDTEKVADWLAACSVACWIWLSTYVYFSILVGFVVWIFFFLMHTVPQFSIIIVRSFILCLAPKLSHGGTYRTPFFPFPSYQFIAYSVPTQLNTDLKPLPSAQWFHAVWEEQE